MTTPPTLRPGDTGPHVVAWQLHGLAARRLLLDSQVSGTMDPPTVVATRAYQRTHGLHPDGIVGPLTWGYAGFVPPAPMLFEGVRRKRAIRVHVLHHSVTGIPRSAQGLVPLALDGDADAARRVDVAAIKQVYDVLLGRGLSTHHILGPFGTLHTTCDPDTRRTTHAAGWNERSEGWDIAAPLDEDAADDAAERAVWPEATAPWAPASDGRRYRADTEACLRALDRALRQRCEATGVPYRAPGELQLIPGLDPETCAPGVYAHAHFQANRWDGFAALAGMRALGIGPERM